MKIKWPWTKNEERSAALQCAGFPSLSFGASGGFINPEAAAGHVVVHRCIQLISETIASSPLRIYRKEADGGSAHASEHPLYTVLEDQFNPYMNAFVGREILISSILINGNAYAKKEYNNAGEVIALWPMMPSSVGVERLDNNRLRYNWMRPDGKMEVLLQEEVLHIRYRTRDGFMGLSPLQIARTHTLLALQQVSLAKDQAESGFKPSGILTIDKVLTPDQRIAVKDNFKGISNSDGNNLFVLEAGMKFDKTVFSNDDAQFIESRKMSNLDLCRVYGVPPSTVGIVEDAHYNNINEEAKALLARALKPMAARIEKEMNASLLSPDARRTLFIRHDLDGLHAADIENRYAAYKLAREGGWLSVNEIREKEHMPKIADGDIYNMPMNHQAPVVAAPSTAEGE